MTPGIDRVFPPIFASSIEHLLAQPEVKEVVDDREIALRLTPPSHSGSTWLVEARDGEDLLAFVPGPAQPGSSEGISEDPPS